MTTDPKARPVSQQEALAALRVAADALDIASDWNVDRLELGDAPLAFGLHPDPDDDEPGWYSTRAVAEALRNLAQQSAAQQSEGVPDDVVARAKTIAHSIYCELGYCGGDAMCFEGADEATKARWIEAVSAALSAVREAAPMAAQHPAPESDVPAGELAGTPSSMDHGNAMVSTSRYPWADAPDWAMWAAQDENGTVAFFEQEPMVEGGSWVNVHCNVGRVDVPCGHFNTNPDWRKSLEARPTPPTSDARGMG
jgi:hypothetical protein